MHVSPPRPGKCTKLTSYVKPPITRAHASGPGLLVLGVALTNGNAIFFVRGRPKKSVLGSILGSAREAAHRRRQTFCFYRAELNPANSRKPRARMHARPFDLRTPVFPLVRPPPVTSRRVVCCVVAKATVEVGLVIAVLITHVTAARRCARRRVASAASVGVIVITSVAARCVSFVVRLI